MTLLLSLFTLVRAEDGAPSPVELLDKARSAIVAKDAAAARAAIDAAEAAAPGAQMPLPPGELGRIFFYRGVLAWQAGDRQKAALDWWRKTRVIAPDFVPDAEALPDTDAQDVYYALSAEFSAREMVTLDLPEDTGDAVIWVSGRRAEPTDSVYVGRHFLQVRCAEGQLVGSWYDFGGPPRDYLAGCSGQKLVSSRPLSDKERKEAERAEKEAAKAATVAAKQAEKDAATKAVADAKLAAVAAQRAEKDAAAKAIEDAKLAVAAKKAEADAATVKKTDALAAKAAEDAKLAAAAQQAEKAAAARATEDAKLAAAAQQAEEAAAAKAAEDAKLAAAQKAEKAAAARATEDAKLAAAAQQAEKAAAAKAAEDAKLDTAAKKADAEAAKSDEDAQRAAAARKAEALAAKDAEDARRAAAARKAEALAAKKTNDAKLAEAPTEPSARSSRALGWSLMAAGGGLVAGGAAVSWLVVEPAWAQADAANQDPGSITREDALALASRFDAGRYAAIGLLAGGAVALGTGVVIGPLEARVTWVPGQMGLAGRW